MFADWVDGPNCKKLLEVYGRVVVTSDWWTLCPPGSASGALAFSRGIKLTSLRDDHTLWLLHRKSDIGKRWIEGVMLVRVAHVSPGEGDSMRLDGIEILAGPSNISPVTFWAIRLDDLPLPEAIDGLRKYIHDQAAYHQNVSRMLSMLEGSLVEACGSIAVD